MNRPPSALLLSWAGLLALLALTVVLAYQPLGRLNTVVALAIASLKVLIIAAIFMELREQRPLVFAFAAAGLFWLAILLWLGSIDFFSRPEFPPPQHMGTNHDPSRSTVAAAFRNGQRPEQV
jgi:cytochrome c oxidase subunit IV